MCASWRGADNASLPATERHHQMSSPIGPVTNKRKSFVLFVSLALLNRGKGVSRQHEQNSLPLLAKADLQASPYLIRFQM